MDGICMRIGWQSIKERFIVFGNRKAIYTAAEVAAALILCTNVQHSFDPPKNRTTRTLSELRSIARKISSFDATHLHRRFCLSICLLASIALIPHSRFDYSSLLLSCCLFCSPRALHRASRPIALNFPRSKKRFFSLFFFENIYHTRAHKQQ